MVDLAVEDKVADLDRRVAGLHRRGDGERLPAALDLPYREVRRRRLLGSDRIAWEPCSPACTNTSGAAQLRVSPPRSSGGERERERTPLRVGTNGCWSSGGLSMSGVTSGLIVTCPNGSSRSRRIRAGGLADDDEEPLPQVGDGRSRCLISRSVIFTEQRCPNGNRSPGRRRGRSRRGPCTPGAGSRRRSPGTPTTASSRTRRRGWRVAER